MNEARIGNWMRRRAPASWSGFCLGLGLLFLLRGLVFLCVYPPLEGFDEHQHLAYLAFLQEHRQAPRYGAATIPESLVPNLIANPHSTYGWQQLRGLGARRYEDFWTSPATPAERPQPVLLAAAFHPPLYYRLVAPLFAALTSAWGFRQAVYLLRMLSLLFAAGAIVLYTLPLQALFESPARARAAALVVSLAPMFLVYAARVSGDALALLISATAFAGLAAAPQRRRAPAMAAAALLGLLLGAGTWVRASVAVWVPAAVIWYLCLALLGRAPWRTAALAAATLAAAAAAVAAPLVLHNLALYRQAFPGQEGTRMALAGKGTADLLAAARWADLWDVVVGRLIRDNLWTSGWLFLPPPAALRRLYHVCLLAGLAGPLVRAVVRRPRARRPASENPRPVLMLCAISAALTFLGAYLHALSSRVAHGAVVTPGYYVMPAFLPLLALVLKAGGAWPVRRLWSALAAALGLVFAAAELYGTFGLAAPQWAHANDWPTLFRRLGTVHPAFPSPAWLPALGLLALLLAGLLLAAIRDAEPASRLVRERHRVA